MSSHTGCSFVDAKPLSQGRVVDRPPRRHQAFLERIELSRLTCCREISAQSFNRQRQQSHCPLPVKSFIRRERTAWVCTVETFGKSSVESDVQASVTALLCDRSPPFIAHEI